MVQQGVTMKPAIHVCVGVPALAAAVVYDINGREAVEAEPVLAGTKATLEQ